MSVDKVIYELEEQLRYAQDEDKEYAAELREAIEKLKNEQE